MVVGDEGYVMLLAQPRFADFAVKPLADVGATTGAIVALSAESRADVDAFAEKALATGGSAAKDPMDLGFMYGRSFLDVDGHHWEIMRMDPAAVEG